MLPARGPGAPGSADPQLAPRLLRRASGVGEGPTRATTRCKVMPYDMI